MLEFPSHFLISIFGVKRQAFHTVPFIIPLPNCYFIFFLLKCSLIISAVCSNSCVILISRLVFSLWMTHSLRVDYSLSSIQIILLFIWHCARHTIPWSFPCVFLTILRLQSVFILKNLSRTPKHTLVSVQSSSSGIFVSCYLRVCTTHRIILCSELSSIAFKCILFISSVSNVPVTAFLLK